METFALILLLTVAAPDGRADVQASVLDHGLTLTDCLAQWEAIEPNYIELPEGAALYVNATCESEY